MNTEDTYHSELTAHLAAQEFPQPHPKRYDHGYAVTDMRLRDFGLTTVPKDQPFIIPPDFGLPLYSQRRAELPQPTRPFTDYLRTRMLNRLIEWSPFVAGFAMFAWWLLE